MKHEFSLKWRTRTSGIMDRSRSMQPSSNQQFVANVQAIASAVQPAERLAQSGGAIFDRSPVDRTVSVIKDRQGIITRPIEYNRDAIAGLAGQSAPNRLHVSFLAGSPIGQASFSGAWRRLPVRPLIGAQQRSVLAADSTPARTARHRRSHAGHLTANGAGRSPPDSSREPSVIH
jgi:hypothetical protein